MEKPYGTNPQYIKNFLYVGNTVLIKGVEKTVESITLTENALLDGTDVPAVPWIAKGFFSVTLSDKSWACGSQIEQIK